MLQRLQQAWNRWPCSTTRSLNSRRAHSHGAAEVDVAAAVAAVDVADAVAASADLAAASVVAAAILESENAVVCWG